MFYNFYVDKSDRNFLRFLWFDQEMQPTHYRMKVHIFGASSSPAVATYCLRRIAQDYSDVSPEASKFIVKDFYVDDGLTSVASVGEAMKLIYDARSICDKGNVRLHKFLSNDRTVLESIPESERSVQNSELFGGDLPTQRTLGLQWSVETDTFGFSSSVEVKDMTRRAILSTVAKIYDPIGFLAPFTLKGKLLLQELCRQKLSWDDVVPEDVQRSWQEWVEQLKDLQDYKIERCMKSKDFGPAQRIELHHFCDASSKGYGACSYIRMENAEKGVHNSLLMAKARVAPVIQTTIPRLELQGAVLASRLSQTLKKELNVKLDAEYFWCDSMIVLGYINNVSKRFHIFVANRVDEIRTTTNPDQWHHIKTSENPADVLSRGANITELKQSLWLRGPTFLWKEKIDKEVNDAKPKLKEVTEEDPEVRKVKSMAAVVRSNDQDDTLAKRFDKFSSMTQLVRAVANLKSMARNKSWKRTEVSLAELEEAEKLILLSTQKLHFEQEVKSLQKETCIRKDSRLAKLNPYMDDEGLLRVGGRLNNAVNLNELQKHPVVVPKSCHIAKLIVRHYHEQIHHLGHRSTLAAIRDAGFWLVNGPGLTKTVIGKCTICARLRRTPETQQMGVLPAERATKTPPFTHVGIDVFGPFVVKQKRTEHKRWGLLFTCLYSRAVHVEVLEELTTDAFLNALRCFIAIRGPVKTLFSDQGTNFVGANNMLHKLMDLVKEPEMKTYLMASKITFKMNTPNSSHQGGAWERLIRSVRAVLNAMTLKYKGRMDNQTLRTALYEAMAIVNSRPLTASTIDNPELNIISPNHLLTMKTSSPAAPPPGKFEDDEVYSRLCWRRAQCFAEEFWKTWKSEYLTQLTQRQKWTHERQNVKVGDVVTLVEQDAPRATWKLGIVSEVMPGSDGLVRKVKVRMGNPHITMKGIPFAQPTLLERPVQKIVIVSRA